LAGIQPGYGPGNYIDNLLLKHLEEKSLKKFEQKILKRASENIIIDVPGWVNHTKFAHFAAI